VKVGSNVIDCGLLLRPTSAEMKTPLSAFNSVRSAEVIG
jgi:hypothetical protein